MHVRLKTQKIMTAYSREGLGDLVRDGSTQNRNYYGQAPPPMCLPSVHLTSPHVTKSPRPSPSVFAYCKWSKYWRWERPGSKTTVIPTQVSIPMSSFKPYLGSNILHFLSITFNTEMTYAITWSNFTAGRQVCCAAKFLITGSTKFGSFLFAFLLGDWKNLVSTKFGSFLTTGFYQIWVMFVRFSY